MERGSGEARGEFEGVEEESFFVVVVVVVINIVVVVKEEVAIVTSPGATFLFIDFSLVVWDGDNEEGMRMSDSKLAPVSDLVIIYG